MASKTALLMTAAGGVGGGLATTSGLAFGVVVDEHHLYVVGDLGEVQDGVGGPLQAGDAAVVEGDFLVLRAAQRLDDVALYLVVQGFVCITS